mgnify:CR=1 FL=1
MDEILLYCDFLIPWHLENRLIMKEEREDEKTPMENIGSFIYLLIEYLRIVLEKEMKEAEEKELLEIESRQHEEQYPGTELDDWFYGVEFTFEWL